MDPITCNSTAQDWFAMAFERIVPQFDQLRNNCWPWKQFGPDDWMFMNKLMVPNPDLLAAARRCQVCISVVGFVGSLLCMATVWHKAFSKGVRFYKWMFAIASLDLFYNVTFIWVNLPDDDPFKVLNSQTYNNAVLRIILKGFAPGFSFASDLCTLCLTIERFLKLKTTMEIFDLSRISVPFEAFCIFLLGSTRCLIIGIQRKVEIKSGNDTIGFKYDYANNLPMVSAAWRSTLAIILNTITPFVLLFVMIAFTVRIGIIVIKRRNSIAFKDGSTEALREMQKQSKTTVSLCFCLGYLFCLCQLGWCLTSLATQMLQQTAKLKTFESSYAEIIQVTHFKMYAIVATNPVVYIFECLSKSLNFFIYFAFVTSFREEFTKLYKRIFRMADVQPLY